MERHEIMDLMKELQLYGMRASFDEVIASGLKRQHPVQQIVADLLKAEIAEKKARSIKYQMTIAKLPLVKEIDDFGFTGTPINQALIRDLASGGFIVQQRNAVLVGGTGTGKSHLAIAIALPQRPPCRDWRPPPCLELTRRTGEWPQIEVFDPVTSAG